MPLPPLDFPASPAIGDTYPNPPVTGQPTYKWDGSVWLAFDEETPGPEAPTTYAKKNYIVNGAMMVNQEGTSVGVIPLSTPNWWPADQFQVNAGGTAGNLSVAQVASATPGGSTHRIRMTTSSPGDPTVSASDIVWVSQKIEGLRFADLKFGTANAKTITIQFGVKAPAGTYCVTLRNGANNRARVAEYVIAAGEANTDVVKSVTIAGDIIGTWPTDNTAAVDIEWALMVGSTFQTPAGVWTAGNFLASANQFNLLGTVGNVFELFDVSLTEGSVAPPFQVPDYASELALCKRYFNQLGSRGAIPFEVFAPAAASTATNIYAPLTYPQMRAAPTVTTSAAATFSANIAGTAQAATAISAGAPSPTASIMTLTVPGAFTAGASGLFQANSSAVAFINLNARL